MGSLALVAFDIETSGFSEESVVTVAGLAHTVGEVVVINTGGRPAPNSSPSYASNLQAQLRKESAGRFDFKVCQSEEELLRRLGDICSNRLDPDNHYLTAYNGEVWNGGFDLPFLRTSCVQHGVEWPFPELAYADMMDVTERFDTNDVRELVGVYDQLIGEPTCDPFNDSEEAVDVFKEGDWEALVLHNLADIQRTHALAVLASEYVPKSDFQMKNLAPPDTN
jgi:uncharacterized protein YprB with RNaseH-like and TPR domain